MDRKALSWGVLVVLLLVGTPCLAEAKDDLSFSSELATGVFGLEYDRVYYVTNGNTEKAIELKVEIQTKQAVYEQKTVVKPGKKKSLKRTKGPTEGTVKLLYAKYVEKDGKKS